MLKVEGEIFVGVKLNPSITIIGRKVFKVSIPAVAGIRVTAESRDPDPNHACFSCYECNIRGEIYVEADLKIFNKKIGDFKITFVWGATDFYYSVDFYDVGFGECPHEVIATEPPESTAMTEPIETTVPVTTVKPTEEVTDPTEPQTTETEPAVIDFGNCGDNVFWVLTEDGVLELYGTGDMDTGGSNLDVPWYNYLTFIKEAIINYGVNNIDFYAFGDCINLAKVYIPDSVTTIGDDAFINCEKLTSISIPDSVTSIGYFAFHDCDSLKSLIIGDSVTDIGKYAFSSCGSLTSVVIPDSVINLGENAFSYCKSLTEVKISQNITVIENWVFNSCTNLSNVTIPNNVTKIGSVSFAYCTNLKSITIPDSVIEIGDGAFNNCKRLSNISISKNISYMGDYVFSACENLTSITIPDGVTDIGASAFNGCKKLANVLIPDGIVSIGKNAFSSCTSLTDIKLPNSVEYIGSLAFYNCNSLTEITIPESVESIREYAFTDCESLTDVYIYGNPTVGERAFPETTTIHYMNSNNVSASLAATKLIGNSSASVAEFDNLIAGGDYIIAVVKSESVEDLLSADNLLYIEQLTADENGSVSLEYVPRETVENSVALIFGADRISISNIEVKALKDEGTQDVEYIITLNGVVLTENTDYELTVDGSSVTVTGINNYKASVTVNVEPVYIGDVNKDNAVSISDVTSIMKYIVEQENFDDDQKLVADTNGDGIINISDATQIQKYLAKLITSFK